MTKHNMPIIDRIMAHVVVNADGCWEWSGAATRRGYGLIRVGGILMSAHRTSYEALRGPIPPGLVLDHLCKNTYCVNPDHLEAVTQLVNMRRGANATKTHCKRGHLLAGDNLYMHPNGKRLCRACRVVRSLRAADSTVAATPAE